MTTMGKSIRSRKTKWLSAAALSALSLSLTAPSLVMAQSGNAPARIEFESPARPLGEALRSYGVATDRQLVFAPDLVRGLNAPAVTGTLTPDQALTRLLAGSGLSYTTTEAGVVVIQRQPQPNAPETTDDRGEDAEGEARNASDVSDRIVVTGTNIRGVTPDSSPLFIFGREDIELSGVSTLAEFIDRLPQNFGGGSQQDIISLPTDRTSSANFSAGSSINLRGTGSGSTLVLLNGRRIAPSGLLGDFVDISMIPLSAIERIEVVTDGASAIYGADAIGGVVNIVLRDNYTGLQSFAGLGIVTEGELTEHRAGLTLGRAWGHGNVLASYEFYDRDSLSVLDREFSAAQGGPNSLLPGQRSHSFLLTVGQDLTDRLSFNAEAAFTERTAEALSTSPRQVDPRSNISVVEQLSVSGGLIADLWGDWQLDFSASYSENIANSTISNANSNVVDRTTQTDSSILSVDARADGAVADVPGGKVRMALGVGFREEDFQASSSLGPISDGARDSLSVFAEGFIPLIGEANRISGVERLELTLSGRYDDFSDFGDAFNPKVGLLWSPFDGLNFRGTYGESFNPPNLGDSGSVSGRVFAQVIPNPASPTGTSVAIIDFRPPDLGPESSTNWTAGFDYASQLGRGDFELSATWYDISYVDRIGFPGAASRFLNEPIVFADLITPNPSASAIDALVNNPNLDFFNFSRGAWTMVGDEDFLLDQRFRNLATQDTSGLDISLSYLFETELGRFDFDLSGAYVFQQEQRITSTSPVFDVIDTIFYPADLRLRGGVSWQESRWRASAFVNFVDEYTDDRNLGGVGDVPVEAWTTVDASLGFETGDRGSQGILSNFQISLNIQNLFDEAPPFIEGSAAAFGRSRGFDPSNADPLGRFVSVRVTKDW